MKRNYMTPTVEKIAFDYKAQIVTTSPTECYESIMNIRVGSNQCGEGTSVYIGWTLEQTGV